MTGKLTRVALAAAFATALAGPALAEQPKGPKHTPAHEAAVQKCTEAYEAAAAAAKAPNSPTGKRRMTAMHAAAEAKKACVAKAPK